MNRRRMLKASGSAIAGSKLNQEGKTMINIIKSLNYSARRDTVNWITILSMLGLPAFIMYISEMISGESLDKVTPSAFFASQQMASIFLFLTFGTMILACKAVAGDAGDKTINYEFMAGHSRSRIFVGRMITGYLWGVIITFVTLVLPLGYLYLFYGWGPETVMKEVLIRSALVIFPIIRMCTLYMMLATILRSAGKGIAISYAIFMAEVLITSILSEVLEIDIIYPTGLTNAEYLLISKNARYVVIDGKTVSVWDTVVTSEMIWKTIVYSIVFSVVYLTIAYLNFKKKDRD